MRVGSRACRWGPHSARKYGAVQAAIVFAEPPSSSRPHPRPSPARRLRHSSPRIHRCRPYCHRGTATNSFVPSCSGRWRIDRPRRAVSTILIPSSSSSRIRIPSRCEFILSPWHGHEFVRSVSSFVSHSGGGASVLYCHRGTATNSFVPSCSGRWRIDRPRRAVSTILIPSSSLSRIRIPHREFIGGRCTDHSYSCHRGAATNSFVPSRSLVGGGELMVWSQLP